MKEAADALLETLGTLDENDRTSEEGVKWINGELSFCACSFVVRSDTCRQSSLIDAWQPLRVWAMLQHIHKRMTKLSKNTRWHCPSVRLLGAYTLNGARHEQ